MLVACGTAGLMVHREGGWHRVASPLPCPGMLAGGGGQWAVLDHAAHAAWVNGRVISVDSGVETMALWQKTLLVLSGDTDCLTMFSADDGQRQLTIPAGVYPQDMCLLPGGRSMAVCGGADGMVRVIRLPELWEEQAVALPGNVQRVACLRGMLYVLCAMEEDGVCCRLYRIRGNAWQRIAQWPGLPGAIHTDGLGNLWVAASEMLACFTHGEYKRIPGDFGLIRHMDSRGGMLLASDPVMGVLWQVKDGRARVVCEGGVEHGVFLWNRNTGK